MWCEAVPVGEAFRQSRGVRQMACRDSVIFTSLSVSNIFLTPALDCRTGVSGLDMRFGSLIWIFSGSNQPISISLRQSRVPIPKNAPTKSPWPHKFEEQSLNGTQVSCCMVICGWIFGFFLEMFKFYTVNHFQELFRGWSFSDQKTFRKLPKNFRKR